MSDYKIKTPYGTIVCHKGRSFGRKVWKKPALDRKFGMAYFDESGRSLYRDVFAFYDNNWIPSKGNLTYHKKITHRKWVELGKPKSIDGKKLGIVVKSLVDSKEKVENTPSFIWDAKEELSMLKINIKQLVTKDMKYIVPLPESIVTYNNLVITLDEKDKVLLTKKLKISSNSLVWYRYLIFPIGKHLIYVELLNDDLTKPFPLDALIPKEQNVEVGEIIEEDVGDII